MARYYDLSHTIRGDGKMQLYSTTAPQPIIRPYFSHDESVHTGRYENCTCEITQINMLTSIGTHLDSPFHFHKDKTTISELRLDQLIKPGIVVDVRNTEPNTPIPTESLQGLDINGKAVLFWTGRDQYWETDEYHNFPFINLQLATTLKQNGAAIVGIDALLVDTMKDKTRPAHVTLLGADIIIVEDLCNLGSLPPKFQFVAVPTKIEHCAAFPVRAFAIADE